MKKLIVLHSANNAIVNYLVWSFFSILVYRVTGRIDYIFLTMSVLNLGGLVGFILGTLSLRLFQTNTIFIISNIIQGIVILMMLLTLDIFGFLFAVFSFFRGVSTGLAIPATNVYLLKDIRDLNRSEIINVIKSVTLTLGVFIPLLSGLILVNEKGYQIIFLIGTIISFLYFVTVFFNIDNHPNINFNWTSTKDLLKRKSIKLILAIKAIEQGAIEIFISCMTIVPFLILGSEFGVGGLKSGAILFSALVIFLIKKKSVNIRFRFGAFGALMDFISQVILVTFWTVPALLIRQVIHEAFAPFRDTMKTDLGIRIDDKLLGMDLEDKALEITFLNVVFGYLAKILITMIGFFLISNINLNDAEQFLKILIIASSLGIFISIYIYRIFLQKID